MRASFIIFGENAASEAFVARKVKKAAELNVEAEVIRAEAADTEAAVVEVRKAVERGFDGIVVQLPLPAGLDTQTVINAMPAEQDVDLLTEEAKKLLKAGETKRVPPVAYAARELLRKNGIELAGKKIVMLGMGRLVGEPVALWLEREGMPFTTIDITTPEAQKLALIASADILITGIGVPHYVKPEMVKRGSVIIDAGTSSEGGALKGDVDPACASVASYISPVPGGVGPLTVEGLLKNLFL